MPRPNGYFVNIFDNFCQYVHGIKSFLDIVFQIEFLEVELFNKSLLIVWLLQITFRKICIIILKDKLLGYNLRI